MVAEGGGACRDCRCDCWHLIDSVLEFAAEGVEQEAAHVLALLDAASNTLTMKFWEKLFQPHVDCDRGGAERRTVGAVEPPFVAEDVTERASGRRIGRVGAAAVRASRAGGLGQPERIFCCHEQRAKAVSGDRRAVFCERVTAMRTIKATS